MAKIKKHREFYMFSFILQVLGVLMCFFVFPGGILIGIVLFIAGTATRPKYLVCSECGNKIENKEVKLCPVCKADF